MASRLLVPLALAIGTAVFYPGDAARAAEPVALKVITPKAHFGFNLGDDYCLANYEQYTAYLAKLAKESDRIKVVDIGRTEERRPQLMAVVTSPANHKLLSRYQTIARNLANADGITSETAKKLAAEGKAVVWIDGGLHASEVLCAQALAETVYQMVSGTDPETLRVLDDVIILFVHANPDGHDLMADWYMRDKDPKKRSLGGLPRLYQKYIGHDNNRDFYANTQAETRNMNRVMYREWLPQIVYNHHQTGPPGTVLFCPPFRDPFNYNFDPLVVSGIDAVGAAMMQRFLAEDKPGATTRSGARYSTWFNGGLRTTAYFHNMIGLLTETIGSPTPMRVPFNPALQLPKADLLSPVAPQEWHFRRSIEYSVTANKAVFDYASRHREQLLYNIWLMGKNATERGNRDSWTVTPKMVAAAKGARGADAFQKFFRDPTKRDARGYVVPADQPDFLTATKFVNALIGTGVRVHRATSAFEVSGKKYPAGSYVVKSAQAVRAHVLDMFEPQDHPDDFAYPGAPPTPPYDAAGYTLAFQMGVQFDRVLEGFTGPFEELKDEVPPPPAKVLDANGAVGFFLRAQANDGFRAVNQLLAAGEEVRRLKEPCTVDGVKHPAGMFFIVKKDGTQTRLEKIAQNLGTRFVGSKEAPEKEAVALKPVRIALVDRYGGAMPSGWTRWLFEQFEFSFTVVYPPDLDRGGLRDKFDVIVVVDGLGGGRGGGGGGGGGDQPPEPNAVDELALPAEFRGRRGSITATKTVPELKKFVTAGGTLLTIGSSTSLANQLGLKIESHLVETGTDGKEKPLGRDKFYVPPSVLRAKVDPTHSLAWGMSDEVDVMFANSPTFRFPTGAAASGLTRVSWFAGKAPLRSGWAFGQEHLDGGTAVIDATVGKGKVVLYGPQVLYRAQPHATFKLVFNAIVRAGQNE
ncbi:peptidase : Gll0760 protein OS=Gloeobacter violaceus (strain PCC 7421) GN=gll0760 PE=4 SV=1: Peptidase_M14 [Gemmata massiliana]|uniref:Peptidase M14 domain-containing protein n=1 Tax=Gemmata massiliana TaxID=1210884 RepID=A0A6P2D4V5_9BACT|nr:M14 metallopeptidase family protein [Gemmata massiliana]VTR96331.1 peptidase : Gll0760 protein OS=Gloeobacter violaceus (strain PCC 7421) GN=gll0760 PE=4 SV=1: Peptidase_M14 [Gemmata massiliana]